MDAMTGNNGNSANTANADDTLREHLTREATALVREIERLTEIVRQTARDESADVAELVGDVVRDISDRASSLASRITGEVSDGAAGLRAAASRGRTQVEEVIRDRPLTSVSVAAVAGLLLGMVLRR